jgi:signal transduction histidine kinase
VSDPSSTSASGGLTARSTREWVADAGFAVAAAVFGAVFVVGNLNDDPPVEVPPLGVELVVGGAACAALFLVRRRWPVGLLLGLMFAGILSVVGTAASFLGVLNVAIHRSWRVTAALAGLHFGWAALFFQLVDMTPRQYRESVVFTLLMDAALVASGLLVRSQRLLVRSLRDRARQAEEETRRLERERIAREMHDVLAHRISLLAMHAGALEFRPEAPAEEITRAAGVIRRCAFEALEDLREVIGVLRDDSGAVNAERPQPTLADLTELIDDSQRTGMPVTLDTQISDLGTVPAGIGRHAYRIVQEGLTNARKHAPGAHVRVAVAGTEGTELTVELRNPLPPNTAAAQIPGAGAGLIGLRERVDLVGGRLEHGRTPDGHFRLWMSLPWPR